MNEEKKQGSELKSVTALLEKRINGGGYAITNPILMSILAKEYIKLEYNDELFIDTYFKDRKYLGEDVLKSSIFNKAIDIETLKDVWTPEIHKTLSVSLFVDSYEQGSNVYLIKERRELLKELKQTLLKPESKSKNKTVHIV